MNEAVAANRVDSALKVGYFEEQDGLNCGRIRL